MKETSNYDIQAALSEQLRNNSDSFKSRFMLDILFGYFEEVSRYVCDKMFTDFAYWYPNNANTALQIDVVDISKEFGEEVIKPWLAGWHERNKRMSAKAPYLKYLKNNTARIIIPLVAEEKNVLRSTKKYEGELIKQKDEGWKEGDKL